MVKNVSIIQCVIQIWCVWPRENFFESLLQFGLRNLWTRKFYWSFIKYLNMWTSTCAEIYFNIGNERSFLKFFAETWLTIWPLFSKTVQSLSSQCHLWRHVWFFCVTCDLWRHSRSHHRKNSIIFFWLNVGLDRIVSPNQNWRDCNSTFFAEPRHRTKWHFVERTFASTTLWPFT